MCVLEVKAEGVYLILSTRRPLVSSCGENTYSIYKDRSKLQQTKLFFQIKIIAKEKVKKTNLNSFQIYFIYNNQFTISIIIT